MMGLFRKRVEMESVADLATQPGEKVASFENLGMNCVGCRMNVEVTLHKTSGVRQFVVDLKNQSATVVFDPKRTSSESIQSAIRDAGYNAEAVTVTEA